MVMFDAQTFLALKLQEARLRAGRAAWTLTAAQAVAYPLVHLFFAIDDLVHPAIRSVHIK
jgi:hypothetical protein